MEQQRSCIDCSVKNCNVGNKSYPEFCPTTKIDEVSLKKAQSLYDEDENSKVAKAAAEVEAEFYCKMTRVEETMEFARKMNFKKIGIATCVGLIKEASVAAKIFRANGFQVYGAACKVGAQKKTSIGISKECEYVGENMCNPILQAQLLNEENTDLNVMIGLCVGHDSLFYKHSEALVTTLVSKDRVLGHNPVNALVFADTYYSKLLEEHK